MKKRHIKIYTVITLITIILGSSIISCKSDVNMTRRKKSRCNTCPTFSYLPNNQYDAASPDVAELY
ncbi:MAG: hypothetical protein J5605_07140 [Bacteroidales bacterium]|nr:hypothetical protein [Bacteroidales bacterium]